LALKCGQDLFWSWCWSIGRSWRYHHTSPVFQLPVCVGVDAFLSVKGLGQFGGMKEKQ
jgi:hypothetical protein